MAVYNLYFSPTGGTEKVANIVAGGLSECYENINLFSKTQVGRYFKKDDICIISVPAFGGRIPENAIEKLKLFKADKSRTILIAVFGNRAIDDTLIEMYDVAISLGFEVVAGIEAVAEHSLVRVYGAGRPNEQDKKELENFAKQILLKIDEQPSSVSFIPGNRPYKDFKAFAMSLKIDETCVNCKKCAVDCPVNAISMDNVKTVDSEKCFSCMHCVTVCPKKARHNSPEVTSMFEKRLYERCIDAKSNKLYL